MRAKPQYLNLQTTGRHSGLPREIEIWFTEWKGRYYVIAEGGERAQWVKNVRANPAIRFQVAGRRFHGQARILDPFLDGRLIACIRQLSRQKYGWGEGLVVELEAFG